MKPIHEAHVKFGKSHARVTGPNLATAIREFRAENDQTDQDIADAVGIARSTIWNLLSDVRKNIRDTAEKATIVGICSVVGVKYDDVAEDVT